MFSVLNNMRDSCKKICGVESCLNIRISMIYTPYIITHVRGGGGNNDGNKRDLILFMVVLYIFSQNYVLLHIR